MHQNHIVYLYTVILLFCGTISIVVYGQQGLTPFSNHFGVNEGLPSSEVYTVHQGLNNELYFGTDHGVVKYNGQELVTYDRSNGLGDNTIFQMRNFFGKTWMLGLNSRLYYFEGDSVYPYEFNDVLQKNNKRGLVTSFCFDSNRTLYVGCKRFGYTVIDSTGKVLQPYPRSRCNLITIEDSYFFYLIPGDVSGDVRATWNKIRYFINNHEVNNDLLMNHISVGSADVNSNYICLSADNLLILHNRITKKDRVIEMPQNIIRTKFIGKDLWVGFREAGCKRFRIAGSSLVEIQTLLPHYSVSDVHFDHQEGAWCSTLENGVFHFPNINVKTILEYEGVPLQKIVGVVYDPDLGTVIGLESGKLVSLRHNQILLDSIPRSSPAEYLMELANVPGVQSPLVLGIGPVGVLKKGGLGKVDFETINTNLRPARMMYDDNGENWLAAVGPQAMVYNKWNLLISNEQQSAFARLSCAELTRSNRIICGTTQGVYEWLNGKPQQVLEWIPALQNKITCIDETATGELAIGTSGDGIVLVKGNEYRTITVNDGLANNIINSVLADDSVLWVGTNKGLNRVELGGQNRIDLFDMNDGLVSNEVHVLSRSSKGLWVGAVIGASFIPNKNLNKSNGWEVPVRIKPYSSKLGSLLDKQELEYWQNEVAFEFDVSSFLYQDEQEYRYRLRHEEEEETWNYGAVGTVKFERLTPGDYVFEVQWRCPGREWEWSSNAFTFTVLNPWWLKWYVVLLSVIVVLVILWVIFRFSIRVIRKRTALKMNLVKARKMALAAQVSPHFIFNSINSVQGKLMEGDRYRAVDTLNSLAALTRRVLVQSREEWISLENELKTIDLYIQQERARINKAIEYIVKVDPEIEQAMVLVPPLMLQPMIENAIWHGLVASDRENGMIELIVSRVGDDLIQYELLDNGIGYTNSMKKESKTKLDSLGIRITKERLANFSEQYPACFIEIGDREYSVGTKVLMVVPIKEASDE